jgi:pyrimidine operon attenuation protein/uracil phosphoribosyltransferase
MPLRGRVRPFTPAREAQNEAPSSAPGIEPRRALRDLGCGGHGTRAAPNRVRDRRTQWLLAHRIVDLLAQSGEKKPSLGAVDITLYRDDVFLGLPKPEIGPTDLHESLDGRTVVLVDDVLFTGRTVRAAMDVLADYGRPRAVQLAVLVDRGRRELPIQPDFVGVRLQTSANESVRVMLTERGEPDRVVLREKVSK